MVKREWVVHIPELQGVPMERYISIVTFETETVVQ